ncbi:hypothetical protein BGW39_007204 [Mortierella sp. 14UC]|nr:hypothetical protein BGW39_007204 [Mortierella sp. 14UC]
MVRVLENHIRSSCLWNNSILEALESKAINEDTFLDNAVKPIINGVFSDLPHVTIHWTRDRIRCGDFCSSEELLFPNCHISVKNQSILVLEAKPSRATAQDYRDDRVKLMDELRLTTDGLLRRGMDEFVVGILVTGYKVEMFVMSLIYEACYVPVEFGTFTLVEGRFQIGGLLGAAAPLLAARAIVSKILADMRGVPGKPIKESLVRGTYHTKPLKIA